MNEDTVFGIRIEELRIRDGLNKKDVMEMLGIKTYSTYNKLAYGKSVAKARYLARALKGFNLESIETVLSYDSSATTIGEAHYEC